VTPLAEMVFAVYNAISERNVPTSFQPLCYARYAIGRICYRPSVRPSVCLSDVWMIQKRLNLGL